MSSSIQQWLCQLNVITTKVSEEVYHSTRSMLGDDVTDAINHIQNNIMEERDRVRNTEDRSTIVVISALLGTGTAQYGDRLSNVSFDVLMVAALQSLTHCGLVEDLHLVRQNQSLLK